MHRVSLTFRCAAKSRGSFRVQTQFPEWLDPQESEASIEYVISSTLDQRCPVTGAQFTRDDIIREEWDTDD